MAVGFLIASRLRGSTCSIMPCVVLTLMMTPAANTGLLCVPYTDVVVKCFLGFTVELTEGFYFELSYLVVTAFSQGFFLAFRFCFLSFPESFILTCCYPYYYPAFRFTLPLILKSEVKPLSTIRVLASASCLSHHSLLKRNSSLP